MMTSQQLEQLIRLHRRPLELFARQWTSSPEDCVQDAFLRLFRCPDTVDNPKAWLFRVVRNLAIDASRSDQSRRRREQTVGQRQPWFQQNDSHPLNSADLELALGELPVEYREIIVARIWGHLTLQEIADAFDVATSTVHRRYQLGIQQLQSYFEINSRKSPHE